MKSMKLRPFAKQKKFENNNFTISKFLKLGQPVADKDKEGWDQGDD